VKQGFPECEVRVEEAPRSGQENMDLDQQLLARVVEDESHSVVRLYRWKEPTVSLGYFQKADAQIDPRIQHCPRVRRITGGGAILHDNEWTYSCALPITHSLRACPLQVYEVVHDSIIQLLATQGIHSQMRQSIAPSASSIPSEEPFLCFLRSDPRDIVLNGFKIVGSAQRRRKGTILQNGSIMLRASQHTPDVPGIGNLEPDFDSQAFAEKLPEVLGAALADTFRIHVC
jgi:lipoate-protein ligase A